MPTAVENVGRALDLEVAVIGFGPVGQTLTALLGQAGVDVAAFERFSAPYGLPRAIRLDHEAMRIFQSLGITDELLDDMVPVQRYEWFGADGKPIVTFDIPDGPSGWPFSYTFYQPNLEDALDRAARSCASGRVERGWTLVSLENREDHVELGLERTHNPHEASVAPELRTVRARYVVGADGASSFVRQASGIAFEDLGFSEQWLVVDVLPEDPSALELPEFPLQFCDPSRPHMTVPNGRRHRRWEFMLLPGERPEDFQQPERVWAMLASWLTPRDATIVRHAVYEFRSAIATSMRAGRCFLAGDAAHLMPPHLGEGMCSGLRDANNLAWKLELALRAGAGDDLLDTYTLERLPHSRTLVDQSQAMGRISCELDPGAAAARDMRLRAAGGVERWPFPQLEDGLLHRVDGRLSTLAGTLGVQGFVERADRRGRCDDLVGRGFCVLARGEDPRAALAAGQVEFLRRIDAQLVALEDGSPDELRDVGGELSRWLDANGVAALITRPDFYVFGTAQDTGELPTLVDDLHRQIGADSQSSSSPSAVSRHLVRKGVSP